MSDDTSPATRQARKLQDAIQHEMAYTDYASSCADAHVTPTGELRECRRAKQHEMPHASGYGSRHQQWTDKTDTTPTEGN